MAVWSPRRIFLAVLVLALLALFAPPFINVSRFRTRIVQSMEQALGRKVTVGSVNLQLLPRPGFELHNLVIGDDPAFGAEPMLRADEVAARLRLASLWRGRLEVASLNLKSGVDISPPSLNLVRAADGRWNIAALLQRTSQTPSAPTAQTKAEARPRFPYIEIDGGRINFKIGQEKKVFVLSDADFTLWLASEDEWAFHLFARPVRTDFNLNDTGTLRISGRFRRARNLSETPLEITAAVEDAQLGALTTLLYGRDRGWRGTFTANAHMAGTPAALDVTTQATVREFRRYDIRAASPLALSAQCNARFSAPLEALSQVDCQLPLGDGYLKVRGDLQGMVNPASYHLNLTAEHVGIQPLVNFAQHAKQDLPGDLTARGNLDASFEVHQEPGESSGSWSGGGQTSEISLGSSVLTPQLKVAALQFSFVPANAAPAPKKPQKSLRRKRTETPEAAATARLSFAPFQLPLGANAPADVQAWFGWNNYQVDVAGDTAAARLLQLGRALGLRVPQYDVSGTAQVDFQVTGSWAGFSPPQITGSAQLHNLAAPMRGLNAPLQLVTATLQLDPAMATLQHVTLRFAGSPMLFTGGMQLPRNCGSPGECSLSFDLQSDQLSMDELNGLLNPALAKHPWYDVFSLHSPGSSLWQASAHGHISAARLAVKSLSAQHVSADVQLQAGVLTINNLRADLWSGKYQGEWRTDFNAAQPQYTGSGTLTGIAMAQVASLMHDNWASGLVDATYHLTMSGTAAGQLASSLTGNATFSWRNGLLRHIALDNHSTPLQFKNFAGQVELRQGKLDLAPSRILTGTNVYEIKGSASLGRQLSLTLHSGSHIWELTGPLDKPKVVAEPVSTPAPAKSGGEVRK
jgi:hypothetical protein